MPAAECSAAVDAVLRGTQSIGDALGVVQREAGSAARIYNLTVGVADEILQRGGGLRSIASAIRLLQDAEGEGQDPGLPANEEDCDLRSVLRHAGEQLRALARCVEH